MEFSAELTGLLPKDTSEGNVIVIKLTAQFDTALLAQLGECFSDRVRVQINHPQQTLDFTEENADSEEEQEELEI